MRKNLKTLRTTLALAIAAGLMSACDFALFNRGDGDQPTAPRTQNVETVLPAEGGAVERDPASTGPVINPEDDPNLVMREPAADGEAVAQSEEAMATREPAEAQRAPRDDGYGLTPAPPSRAELEPGLPRDDKGVVGHPYASNFNTKELIGKSPPAEVMRERLQDSRTQDQAKEQDMSAEKGKLAAPALEASPNVGSQYDLAQYEFTNKRAFASMVRARLLAVDRQLERYKATTSPRDSRGPASTFQKIQDVETKHQRTEQLISKVNQVPRAEWESYKKQIGEALTQLEFDSKTLEQALN